MGNLLFLSLSYLSILLSDSFPAFSFASIFSRHLFKLFLFQANISTFQPMSIERLLSQTLILSLSHFTFLVDFQNIAMTCFTNQNLFQ